ncbi:MULTISPECIES: DUF4245 family protein [Brevibacterium]|uniref:DUF4245 domain-containing protein n=1 Tax=Brevibacterium salitolerans TaxID=1403566 RepID=A0ABN2W8S2_9MICO|nr:DUF4245 family protein [Brevibacterium sp.]
MTDQHDDARTPLPTSTARYGTLDGPSVPQEGPELFPGERAIARTKAGSREEMRTIRRHYNWVNMVIALLACAAVVAVALMFAPQPQGDPTREVDYMEVAATAQPTADFPLAAPAVPEGWHSNTATFGEDGSAAVPTWYISWVNEEEDLWLSLRQVGAEAPETWSDGALEGYAHTGESALAGVQFARYEAVDGPGHALLGEAEGTQLLVTGSTSWEQVETTVEDALASLGDAGEPAPAGEPEAG